MLRFLRKLRHKELAGKQFLKYFLYALGEILLVVIGILLALQIDGWNNQRILKEKELIYVKEIRTNLQDDLERIQYSIVFNKKKDSSIAQSLHTMLNANSDLEAMIVLHRNMPVLAQFRVFTQNRVAFDNMLSAENIDLISSDTLRNLLSDYYAEENLLDGTQERVKELTRVFVDHISPMLMNRENLGQIFQKENNFISANDLNFRTNRVLFGDLYGMQRNLDDHTLYFVHYKNEIETIIAQIDQFLHSGN